jgi:hypothetical protein
MQKQFTTLCAALALIVMLLVAVPKANYSSTVAVWHSGSQLANGIPMPSPKPPETGFSSRVVIADGIPMPPPKPPKTGLSSSVIVADAPPKELARFVLFTSKLRNVTVET